jgi:hypothetical protein
VSKGDNVDDLIEQIAEAIWRSNPHYDIGTGFRWTDLRPDDRAGFMAQARAALAAIAAHPRYELVELPEPTHGPDGEGQLSWHTGTSVISATPGGRVWEEDFDMEPHEAQENAAALLAAAQAAEEPK